MSPRTPGRQRRPPAVRCPPSTRWPSSRRPLRTRSIPHPPRRRHARRRHNHRIIIWSSVALLVVVAASAGVVAARRIERQLPQPTVAAGRLTASVVPGSAPVLPWPAAGQGAVAVPALGYAEQSGPEQPVPIASLTKMTTAVVVLRDHPVPLGSSGPDRHHHAGRGGPVRREPGQQRDQHPPAGRGDAHRAAAARGPPQPVGRRCGLHTGCLGRRLAAGLRGQDERPGRLARRRPLPLRGRQRLRPPVGVDGGRHPAHRGGGHGHPDVRQRGRHAHGQPARGGHGRKHRHRDRYGRDRRREVRLHLPGLRLHGAGRVPLSRRALGTGAGLGSRATGAGPGSSPANHSVVRGGPDHHRDRPRPTVPSRPSTRSSTPSPSSIISSTPRRRPSSRCRS